MKNTTIVIQNQLAMTDTLSTEQSFRVRAECHLLGKSAKRLRSEKPKLIASEEGDLPLELTFDVGSTERNHI